MIAVATRPGYAYNFLTEEEPSMKTVLTKWAVGAAIVAASWQWALSVQAATKAERAEAAKLVDETLRREAREGIEDRREVLRPALELTPACEAAYGPSGFAYDVKRKEWLLPSEIQELAAKDGQLAAYRATRAKYPDTEKGQAQLARWCARRKLDDQARAHWTKVLSFNPEQPEARRQLGFQKVNGTWLGQQEIANARAKVSDFRTSLTHWGRKLEDALKRLGGPNRQASDVARQELKTIKVPDAVPAIEVIFCANGGEYAPLGVELLKEMKAAQAAEALTWLAAFSPWKPVQAAATAALKDQSPHDYVPLLLAAMRTPIQSGFSLYNTPDGGFLLRLALYADWPEQRQLAYFDYDATPQLQSSTQTVGIRKLQQNPALMRDYNRLTAEDQKRQQQDMIAAQAKVMAQVRVQQATFAAMNANTQKLNSRLSNILTVATGDSQPTTPDDWYSWWDDYNEISQQGDKPFLITYQARWEPVVTLAQAPTLTCSCLVAGTPVLDRIGARSGRADQGRRSGARLRLRQRPTHAQTGAENDHQPGQGDFSPAHEERNAGGDRRARVLGRGQGLDQGPATPAGDAVPHAQGHGRFDQDRTARQTGHLQPRGGRLSQLLRRQGEDPHARQHDPQADQLRRAGAGGPRGSHVSVKDREAYGHRRLDSTSRFAGTKTPSTIFYPTPTHRAVTALLRFARCLGVERLPRTPLLAAWSYDASTRFFHCNFPANPRRCTLDISPPIPHHVGHEPRPLTSEP